MTDIKKQKHKTVVDTNNAKGGFVHGDLVGCHLCDMTTKLNVMVSSHRKRWHSDIDKELYVRDIRSFNGVKPKVCKFCNKETTIPYGECEYPKFHRNCYNSNRPIGSANPTWTGGKTVLTCPNCNKSFERWRSTTQTYDAKTRIPFKTRNNFCSYKCMGAFYTIAENKSTAQKNAHKTGGVSKKELHVLKCLTKKYPDIQHSIHLGKFIYDYYIPSLNLFIEMHGNYWHCRVSAGQDKDIRKEAYLHNQSKYPGASLRVIWEHEVRSATDDQIANILNTTANIQSAHTHKSNYRVWSIFPKNSIRKTTYIAIQLEDRNRYIEYLHSVK